MSSATTLYGVRLKSLQAAIGSNDESLREKAAAADRPTGKTFQVTVVFLPNDTVEFNEVPLNPDGLREELRKPQWAGVKLYCIDKRPGNHFEKAAMSKSVLAVITDAAKAGSFVGWEWEQPNDGDEDFPLESAIADLIAGRFSQDDEDLTYQYGYALERICHTVGEHLGTIEGELLLRNLKLKTPLSRKKKPVKLPASDDVPEISFLSEDEVKQEAERLRGIDLAFPKSVEVEDGRKEYAAIVAAAAEKGLAIVAFGY